MAQSGEIELCHLTKRFDRTVAVDAIDLAIPHGSYCCLLGPSGCGKTTILRMIAGHETPTEGDVRIGGESVVGLPPVRRGTALMFQTYALFPHLTVLDNVAFNLKMRGVAKAERHRRGREMVDQGRIEQAGAAREIYTLPVSAYVARFMGGQNVLTGKVASVTGGIATLVSDTGERFSGPLNGQVVAEGDVLHCCVRRDRVALERVRRPPGALPEPTNAVVGAVHAIESHGTYLNVTIDVPRRAQVVR